MSPTEPSSLNPGKPAALPVVNSGSLEGFIKYIGILSSSSETQFASAVLGEISQQRERIHSQDEELDRLRKEILDIKERNRTTIEDMFAANGHEKAKQRDSAAYIENLQAVVNDRENKIAEYSKILGNTQQKIAKLESTCSQEIAKVSQAAKDISELQTSLKEKDKTIDQMKAAGSKLKSMLLTEQKRSEDLEATNVSRNKELQAVRARIQTLEGFAVQSSDIDEKFVEIDRRIFQPIYFLAGGSHLREALDHLAESNTEKEAFCRRIILSINPGAENETLETEIRAVVQRMSSYTGGLFSEAQHDLFCTKIKTIAQNAAKVWLPIQRSQQKFKTDFDLFDSDDDEWDHFPSAGENKTLAAQELQGLYVLNISPCVSLVEEDNCGPLTNIIQLRSSQELYLAAQNEATKTATPATARRSSTRPRRQSTAGSNGKPFLGENQTKD
ncbi:uncharacterized protein N7487_011852 [Penicillium crustosum]|nr:uncharacterized protein N7487_011852 [Penicillium crustosum]KAJ5394211.1 hypothetical protein N7487_011852 [Penicillium crustosum]